MAMCVGPPFSSESGTKLQVMRCYGVLLACCAALLETEWEWLTSMVLLLNNWLVRGLAQAFIAVLTLEIATSAGSSDFDRSLSLYRRIAGSALLGCAGFYTLGGLMCIGALKQERKRRLMERHKVEQHLALLEQQREELRGLLSVYGGE